MSLTQNCLNVFKKERLKMAKDKTLGLTNLITWSNVKLGGQIPQLNMPYGWSCRQDAPCFKECYCTH